MILQTRISELLLLGEQENLVLCFHCKIKICTHLVKFIMKNVSNVEIILVKRKETV